MCFLNFHCRLSCKKVIKKVVKNNYYFFGNFDQLQFFQHFWILLFYFYYFKSSNQLNLILKNYHVLESIFFKIIINNFPKTLLHTIIEQFYWSALFLITCQISSPYSHLLFASLRYKFYRSIFRSISTCYLNFTLLF